MDVDRVGIVSLRTYIQGLLDQYIERELPKVRDEIRNLMVRTEKEILAFGDERPTIAHLRMFLFRLAMQFHTLVISALNGTYHEADSFFFGEQNTDHSTRLRALVHQLNKRFSDYMRNNGQKRKTVEPEAVDDSDLQAEPEEGQILVTEPEMKEWVRKVCSVSSRSINPLTRVDIRQQ